MTVRRNSRLGTRAIAAAIAATLFLPLVPMKTAYAAVLSGDATDYSSFKITSHEDSYLSYAQILNGIQTYGNLRGESSASSPDNLITGYFNYEIEVDNAGWYELIVDYDDSISDYSHEGSYLEYIVDGTTYLNEFPIKLGNGRLKVANVYLSAGSHQFTINNAIWWAMAPITGFEFKPLANDNLAKNVRVEKDGPWMNLDWDGITGNPFHNTLKRGGHYVKTGETFDVNVYTGGNATGTFVLELYSRANHQKVVEYTVNVAASSGEVKHTIPVSVSAEGAYYAKFKANGSYVPAGENLIPVQFYAIDASSGNMTESNSPVPKTLVATIDASTETPDYASGGAVVTGPAGTYRVTGNADWDYYGYDLPAVDRDKAYVMEIDYPDDAEREIYIQFREKDPIQYIMGGGIETGRPYALTNTIKTHSLMFYPRFDEEPRVMVVNPGSNDVANPAAVREIRLYEVNGPLTALDTAADGRDYANYFEEPMRWLDPFGAKDTSPEENVRAVEAWARNMKYMGANVMYPTAVVYSESLFISPYYTLNGSKYTGDIMRLLLIVAEKYGLQVMADFSPTVSDQINKYFTPDFDKRLFAVSKDGETQSYTDNDGTKPLYNPLHPENRQFIVDAMVDFVEQYHDSDAFKGFSLRSLQWASSGFNDWFNLNWGYDDYTGQAFSQYLGVSDPGTPQSRYALFTNGQNLETWIDWRIEVINELYSDIVDAVHAVDPNVEVYGAVLGDDYLGEDAYEAAGIDPSQTDFHYINGAIGIGKKGIDYWLPLRDPGSVGQFADSRSHMFFYEYLEDGGAGVQNPSIGLTGRTDVWTSAHMNAAGRNALERFSASLAQTDAKLLGIGGNTYFLETPEIREWMAEYRQLPKDAFTLRNGSANDPVYVRDFEGTDYLFYLVNRQETSNEVTLAFDSPQTLTRLSNGAQIATDANDRATFALQPFELLVFKSQGGAITQVQQSSASIPPAAPGSFNATTLSSSEIQLTWDDLSNNEAGFKLERRTSSGSYGEIATLGSNAESYIDTNLNQNTQYFYRVRAYNAAGDSAYSNEDYAVTDPANTVPAEPGNFNATTLSDTEIELTWDDLSNDETGFKLERRTASGSYSEIATLVSDTESYIDTGRNPNTQYFYRVRAYNAVGNSAYSNEDYAVTNPSNALPAVPGNFNATTLSSTRIELTWDDLSSNETGFKLERRTASGAYSEIATLGSDTESYVDTGRNPNTQYFYRARAYNAAGNSEYSNEDYAVTLP